MAPTPTGGMVGDFENRPPQKWTNMKKIPAEHILQATNPIFIPKLPLTNGLILQQKEFKNFRTCLKKLRKTVDFGAIFGKF